MTRTALILTLGFIVFGTFCFEFFRTHTLKAVYVIRDMEAGRVITPKDIELRFMDPDLNPGDVAFNIQDVLGKKLSHDIAEGELVCDCYFKSGLRMFYSAARPIARGEIVTKEHLAEVWINKDSSWNYGYQKQVRSKEFILGRRAKKDIAVGDDLRMEDFRKGGW